ncbi:sensor histidine kinase [Sphingomonas gilva]|uniref:C4-dicarboxylate transport sensor protein DctB n=1 Tax=Sphingomonas gilva TaxID=2305907 RepID=A0A396RQK3_9SPHN|nr:ATP-binding protein [Sphingomonas gilva]RHW17562.1 sensor histidine kinase [Sphingomonas gilva]
MTLPRPVLRWLLSALTAAVLAAAVIWGAARWAQTSARAEADAAAQEMARSHAGLLASELQKFRLLPLVLSEYPDARAVLQRDDPAAVARLNDRLALLAERTDAAAIYVIGRDGMTIAASNWRLPTSFVGQDYGFRPYFREALANGAAELFALGTISGRPGLFIARRIEGEGQALGVIVVKVEFDALEAGWARQPGMTFVTDAHGVVIITSRPEWRFRATRPLDEATRAEIRRSIQFGALPLAPLGLDETGGAVRAPGGDGRYRLAEAPVPLAGAHLSYLQPLAPAEASAAANARFAVLSGLILAALAFAGLWRARVRRRALEEASQKLEGEVVARTAELSEANARLVAESAEREAADRRFRAAREELAQANRLGSIGQITAGVAHEINQPVAAIRTFAENAGRFLDRAEPDQARGNLTHIVALTDRIGRITGELRTFARRGTPAMGAVVLDSVIEGALLLIGDRIRAGRVTLDREGDARIAVVADKVRLEQVLINLIQNALDALADTPDPRIAITVAPGERVTIDVADNGPGIAPDIADQLFTPFVTGKRDGLGLGLGIARDIVREFGGRLDTVEGPLGGATFRITLRRA